VLCYRCGTYNPDGSQACGNCKESFGRRRATGPVTVAGINSTGLVSPLNAGEMVVGRYRIRKIVCRGSAGWLLSAWDEKAKVAVALKLIYPNFLQTERDRSKFLGVVKQAQKIHHPHIARIFDAGVHKQYVFYTMPFLETLSLRKIIDLRLEKKQHFSMSETLPLVAQMTAGLGALGKFGAHGALRPDNIGVLPELLKITALPHFQALPHRPFVATLLKNNAQLYLAPEARHRNIDIDSHSDQYSIAAIAGEMLVGKSVTPDIKMWSEFAGELPTRVLAALLRALSPQRDGRFDSLKAFFDALMDGAGESVQEQVVSATPISPEALLDEPTVPDSRENSKPRSAAPAKPHTASAQSPAPNLANASLAKEIPTIQTPRPARTKENKRRGLIPKLSMWLAVGLAFGVGLWAIFGEGQDEETQKMPPVEQNMATRKDKNTQSVAPKITTDSEIIKEPSTKRPDPALPAPIDPEKKEKPEVEKNPVRKTSAAPNSPAQDVDGAPAKSETLKSPPPPPILKRRQPATHKVRHKPTSKIKAIVKAPRKTRACPGGMVGVKAGVFNMGSGKSDPMRGFGDLNLKKKRVGAYCIDEWEYPNRRAKRPGTHVSWFTARKLCEKAGKRLCTEAEWEKACKGPKNNRFASGRNQDAKRCRIGGSAKARNIGANSACKSGLGVFDLSGNVAEWTASQWSNDLTDRVIKGGAAGQADYTARCAARTNDRASSKGANIGFRCCKSLN
jgi:eukaryotic-like serine/threonine-protein kinase